MRNRVTYWEVQTNGLKTRVCNLAGFLRRIGYMYTDVMYEIAKARKANQSSVAIGEWKISWFYTDPLDTLFAIKASQPEINPKRAKKYHWSDRLRGRECFN